MQVKEVERKDKMGGEGREGGEGGEAQLRVKKRVVDPTRCRMQLSYYAYWHWLD